MEIKMKKQPTYTTLLLFKSFAPAEELEVMEAGLSEAQLEGRAPLHLEDVEFIQEYLRTEEELARIEDED
jgi:hypothetical protein